MKQWAEVGEPGELMTIMEPRERRVSKRMRSILVFLLYRHLTSVPREGPTGPPVQGNPFSTGRATRMISEGK